MQPGDHHERERERERERDSLDETNSDSLLLSPVRVVEGMDGSASLYAQSLQGHHILILAKQKGGSTVSVDLRSNDESLCTQVCNEVSGLPLFIA
jgi:hypothetical protein